MEVTKSNFEEVLPSIKEAINECDFMSIDTEFTGLQSCDNSEHAFQTMEERYSKWLQTTSQFLVLQVGLSIFKYHPQQKKYTHRDYNFYVFPRPHIRQSPDARFLCQSSSINFLASHRFDFNKAIYEGIPYLTYAHEEKVRSYLANKHQIERESLAKQPPKANGQKMAIPIPDEHKEFIAQIQEKVDNFICNGAETILQLDPCSPYHRKLIYDSVQQKHTEGIEMSTQVTEDNKRFISIRKCSSQEKKESLNAKQSSDLKEADAAVGFRKVMEYLSESKKLIIGHCMYLDIFHMIEQFFFPLPESLREFKSMVRMTFPHLLDTKYLASSEKLHPFLDSTALGDLAKQLEGPAFGLPPIEPEDNSNSYELNGGAYHEAGFDAFLTGVCYIGLSRKLGAIASPSVEHVETSSKILSPYVNRFHILRHYDISCLNLSGPDPEPSRENVFHVSFPKEWKTVDLVELFLPYGDIYVHWLDEVSALVALKRADYAIKAKSALLHKSSRLYQVKPYSEYNQQLNESSKEVVVKPCQSTEATPTVSKRRNSGSTGSGSRSMDLIPEADENEAETADATDLSPAKKKAKSRRRRTRS